MNEYGHATTGKPVTDTIRPARRWLQRTCDCGNHSGSATCSDCRKKKNSERHLQRHSEDSSASIQVLQIVHDVLDTAGRPLDPDTRMTMESRFAHDFSHVRIHDDARAAESARAVRARAYTVGSHIVFGTGNHRPGSEEGRSLLTHELTHVVQLSALPSGTGPLTVDPSPVAEREAIQTAADLGQPRLSTAPVGLQRACLPASECAVPTGQSAATRATVNQAAQVQRRRRREQLCRQQPPDPACTSDGHAARAGNLERLLRLYRPGRLSLIHGVFVDRDIPADWGAYRADCDTFVPAINSSGNCIFVPQAREQNAGRFHAGDTTIDGMSRADWRLLHLRILMHETGHARFEVAPHHAPGTGGCTFSQIRAELHEIAADMDEFEAAHDVLQGMSLTPRERRRRLGELLRTRWADRARNNWKQIRCVCDCGDAIAHLEHTASTMTSHWPITLAFTYHEAMSKHVPDWPWARQRPLGPGDFPEPRSDVRAA
jgi:hypothetical protein